MGNKAEDERYDRERQSFARQIEDGATLERIADSLERLVIAADSIATALSLQALTPIVPRGMTEEQPPPVYSVCANCGAYPDGLEAKCTVCGRAIQGAILFTPDRPMPQKQHEHRYKGTGGPCVDCGRGIYVERAEAMERQREPHEFKPGPELQWLCKICGQEEYQDWHHRRPDSGH